MAGVLEELTRAGLSSEQIRALGRAKDEGKLPVLSQTPVTPTAVARRKMSPYGKPETGRYTPQQTEQFRNDPRNRGVIDQLTQAAQTRYGQTNDAQVLGLANKVQNEGYPIEKVMEMLRGGYGVKDPNLRYVADMVGMEYDPQQNALTRAQEEAQRQYDRGIRTQEIYGQRADQSLQSIYGALQNELTQNQGALSGLFQDAQQDIGGFYQQAGTAVQGAGQGILERLQQQGQQLGIEAATPAASGDIASDLAFYASQIAGAGAGSQANMAQLGAGTLATGQRGIGDSRRELAQGRGNIVQQVLGAIGDLGIGYQDESRDIRGQLSDLAGSRGAALRTGLTDREQMMWDRAQADNAARLDAEIQRGTLGIQRGELDLQKQDQLIQDRQYADGLRQELEIARMNNSTNRAELEIRSREADANVRKIEQELAAGPGGSRPTSGYSAVDALFKSDEAERISPGGEQGVGPLFRGHFNDIITKAALQTNEAGAIGSSADARLAAIAMVEKLPPTINRELMYQAIDLFFGETDYRDI